MSTDAWPNGYHVTIHQEDDGSFWSEVDELPGCFASGFSLEELREAMLDAIQLVTETSKQRQADRRARSGWVKEAWRKRRGGGTCSRCLRVVGKRYAVTDLHPLRDLCLDCAEEIVAQFQRAQAGEGAKE